MNQVTPSNDAASHAPGDGGGKLVLRISIAALGLFGLLVYFFVFTPLMRSVAEARSMGNLKQIGIAIHNYNETHTTFPLAGSEEPRFGIGLSWRVRILRFSEATASLHKGFNVNEPWNGTQNEALIEQMPAMYRVPSLPPSRSTTVYLAVTDAEVLPPKSTRTLSKRPIFSYDGRATRIADIRDGTANTIMLVEADADQAVTWTRPKDWTFDPQQPRRGLGKLRKTGFLALTADGQVRMVSNGVDDEVLRRLMICNDGQPLPPKLFK